MNEDKLLATIYSLAESKVPSFLFILYEIRNRLNKKNEIYIRETEFVSNAISNPTIGVYLYVCKQRGEWSGYISLLKNSYILGISMDGKVVAIDVKQDYNTKLYKKRKCPSSSFSPSSFFIYVPLSSFIKYIPNIVSSNQIYNVLNFINQNFVTIINKAIDDLAELYKNSYNKLKAEYETVNMASSYSDKLVDQPFKYVLTSDIWIHLVIDKFNPQQILMLSDIFASLVTIRKEIQKEAHLIFEIYKSESIKQDNVLTK